MKQTVIKSFDDLHWNEEREQVPADVEVILEMDGDRVLLDLTEDHASDLRIFLYPYLAAGQALRSSDSSGQGRKRSPDDPVKVAWKARMRKWADSQGREGEYRRPNGIYYSKQLRNDFAQWESANQEHEHKMDEWKAANEQG